MTEIQKTNPMGSQEQQLAARQAFADACGIDISQTRVLPNGTIGLKPEGAESAHMGNFYFNRPEEAISQPKNSTQQ